MHSEAEGQRTTESNDSYRRLRVGALVSGGVDSTVAAALLREQGAEVVGIHLLLGCASGVGCGGADSLGAAQRAAAEVGIALTVVDLRREFDRRVVRPFVRGRVVGRTRNPCVACNAHLRFGSLWERLAPLGLDRLASGHYARVQRHGGLFLARAADPDCDQSYALFAISPAHLARCLFPLGDLGKADVVREARLRGFSAAERRPSQDLCFAAGESIPDLIERGAVTHRRLGPGKILSADGQRIGSHDGVHQFTVGQRRGLGDLGGGSARYVMALDFRSRSVVVGTREQASTCRVSVARVSLADPAGGSRPFRAMMATRYRSKLVPALVVPQAGRRACVLVDPPGAIAAPGQCAVWYDGERVLGGGEIV